MPSAGPLSPRAILHLPLLSTWMTYYSSVASATLLQNLCSQVLVSPSTSVFFMHASSMIAFALRDRFYLPFPPSRREDRRAMTSPFPPPTRAIRRAMALPFPPSTRDDRRAMTSPFPPPRRAIRQTMTSPFPSFPNSWCLIYREFKRVC